jgi:polyhydroxyalkanoate synthesis repressor PhaR
MSEPRVIKKYPNRRLYDTVESRYITLAEIQRLVIEKIDFVVVDKKTNIEITRSILLQVISEQEHQPDPILSQEFMIQVIRAYGGMSQHAVSAFLEQNLKQFLAQQPSTAPHGGAHPSLPVQNRDRPKVVAASDNGGTARVALASYRDEHADHK